MEHLLTGNAQFVPGIVQGCESPLDRTDVWYLPVPFNLIRVSFTSKYSVGVDFSVMSYSMSSFLWSILGPKTSWLRVTLLTGSNRVRARLGVEST